MESKLSRLSNLKFKGFMKHYSTSAHYILLIPTKESWCYVHPIVPPFFNFIEYMYILFLFYLCCAILCYNFSEPNVFKTKKRGLPKMIKNKHRVYDVQF